MTSSIDSTTMHNDGREPVPAESDARFKTLFDQAPFSVQLLDMRGKTVQVNKAWEKLWGAEHIPALKHHVLHGGYNILTDPQLEAKGITPYLRRAFAGESVTLPAICYDPAEIKLPGRARWLTASAHPIMDAAGQVQEVMLVHEDVTEQMQADTALRASELRLKQLANTIPQLAWMADASGAIHWYNERWYEYTGTTPADMEGWGWQAVHDPEILPSVMEKWLQSLSDGTPFEMIFPLRGKDGRYRPFFTLVAPLRDENGVLQWFGTNTDVSAIEQAQQELHAAEERLRLATEAGDIGIWEWDIADNHIIWSDRVFALHGVDPARFTLDTDSFSALIHPDDRAPLWDKVDAAIRDKSGYSAEFRALLPGGAIRWLSTWAKIEVDAQGRAQRLIGATINIDAHKRAEDALLENNRRKDEFLAMLAHELRNPLAPISAAAEILKLPAIDARRISQTSEVISRQVGHMAKLIDELMDVSRVTRGLVQLDLEDLDVKALVLHAVEQVRPLIEARRHLLLMQIDARPVHVRGDRTRLVQILSNLLNNAAKYSPASGEISLSVSVDGGAVRITVADRGQGIEEELLPHVFELFTQGRRAPDRAQGGLGIGLALVKSIVVLHGGQVEAHSAGAGRGSAFTVTLPLAASDAPPPAAPHEQAPGKAAARRILIVDDNQDAANSLAILLEAAGHRVAVLDNAARVAEVVRDIAPDVFILDIGLPDITGYELARQLRQDPRAGQAMFIALSGYGQAHDRELSRAAGFDHHMVKPVETRRLTELLDSALARQG
ncbi:MAG: PAS domain S-box protein [Pseudomonadota bacterium]